MPKKNLYPGFQHRFVGLLFYSSLQTCRSVQVRVIRLVFRFLNLISVQDRLVVLSICSIIFCADSNYEFLYFINNSRFSVINFIFSPFSQFHNTRSKDKGEKEKAPGQDSASDVDVDEANLSLMDRTRHQAKAAKGLAKHAVDPSAVDDDVHDLEEVVFQTRERVKAARAAKARADALRQELLQLI